METEIKLLKSVDLFSPLYDEHLAIFAKIANYKCYHKGDLVLQQNDTENQSFFLIASGQAKVFISGVDGAEVTLAILNPGEFFGEMSLLDGEPRSASVIAVQKSNLLVIRRDDFLNELEKNSRLAKTLLIGMSRRIRNKNNELATLEIIAYGKVTAALMDIVKENGTHSCLTDGTDVNITKNCPSQQQIADMSGTTKETVSDAINYLQKQGIIVLNDDELCVFKKAVLNISE